MRLAKRRRVRPSDPMAVVTRFLEAANQHDADTLYATVHPEFESFQPLHPARNFRGPGQLVSNWRAIFEAEPGFRLTVLRASTTGNTVWVEVHGAGDTAEAAGIFIMGVENSRIRWVRVYSDLVEPAPEKPVDESPPAATTTAFESAEAESVTPGAEPEPTEPVVPEPDATPEPEPVAEAPAAESASDIQTAPGDEGLRAAADSDSASAPAAPPADSLLWLVEPGGGSPDGPDDESPAPPEPGLRLVAPAPLPEPGAGLGSTIDATTVGTPVGSATPPQGPLGPPPFTDSDTETGGGGAVIEDAEPAAERAPAGPPPADEVVSDPPPSQPDLASPEAPADDAAPGPERPSEREAGPERPSEREAGPERPSEREAGPEAAESSPADDPDGPPWSRLRRALGKE